MPRQMETDADVRRRRTFSLPGTGATSVQWMGDFTDCIPAPLPNRAVRLRNGDTLITDHINNRAIRVSPAGRIVACYGLALAGRGPIGNNAGYDTRTLQKGLYAPCDAKVDGDYTGLTPPCGFDGEDDQQ
jgi:hypothetical protein